MHGRRFLLFTFAAIAVFAISAGQAAAQSSATPTKMERWLGHWDFTECWPAVNNSVHDCIVYQLNISQTGDQTIADLDLDGFQTMSRLRGAVERTTNGIRITFAGIREPGLFDDTYKAGDVLFDLSASGDKVLTIWRRMTPALPASKRTGVHFVKVK